MGKYTRIARHLTLIAKRLLEAGKKERFNEYTSILKKERFNRNEINEILEKLDGLQPAKKERVALHWLMNDTLKLPKDAKKLDEAFITLEKHHKRFENYETPDEIIDFGRKRKIEKTKTDDFNPNTCPEFSNKQNLGNGIVVYDVKNTWEGMMAIRTAMDTSWGYDEGKWCLATRDHGKMDRAWNYWKQYDAYQKRIAFKNGKVYMFSTNHHDKLAWWDKDDKEYSYLPGAFDERGYELANDYMGIASDPEIPMDTLEELAEDTDVDIRYSIAQNPSTPIDILEKLAEDKNKFVRRSVAENPNTPVDIFEKLAEDESYEVRSQAAEKTKTFTKTLKKLAEDEDMHVRRKVGINPNTPAEILEKLAEDEEVQVRYSVARNTKTPANIFEKLAEDEDLDVKAFVAVNPSTPEKLLEKLANDESRDVRRFVAKSLKISDKLLNKFAEDEDWQVRHSVAGNTNTPIKTLKMLANDRSEWVRDFVAQNPITSVDILKQLAEDENEGVRNVALERLR